MKATFTQNSIKAIKKEIYEACGFRIAESQYDQIVQKSPPEGARFTIDGGYITYKGEYIPNYLR